MRCQRCGGDLPAALPNQGQPRKWCSENCRKRACEAVSRKACPRCRKPMGVGSVWAHHSKSQKRCRACEDLLRHLRREARIFYAAHLFQTGLSYRAISEALGMGANSKPPEVTEARRRGLIGYRNRGYGEAA